MSPSDIGGFVSNRQPAGPQRLALRQTAHLLFAAASLFFWRVAPVGADTLLPMSLADRSYQGVSAGGDFEVTPGRRQLSTDGRWVVFQSPHGVLLVPGYSGAGEQLFLADRLTGLVRLVSAANGSTTQAANGRSLWPVVNSDGRFVAFTSESTDLVAEVSDELAFNVYLWDRDAAPSSATRLVSHRTSGSLDRGNDFSGDPDLSADGRYVAFASVATDLVGDAGGNESGVGVFQTYFWDGNAPPAEATRRISHSSSSASLPANGDVRDVVLSANGRYATYSTAATDLVAGASGETEENVYLWDRDAPALAGNRLVSHDAAGALIRGNRASSEPRISHDGRYLVFQSPATNLVAGAISNGHDNVYLWDRDALASESMRLVSHTPVSSPPTGGDGYSFDARISGNGRFVTFTTSSTDLGPEPVRGLFHELELSPSGSAFQGPSASGPPLPPPPPTNIYIWDRDAPAATANQRVSIPDEREGDQHDVHANESVVSDDGRYVAYRSFTRDLTRGVPYSELPPTDLFLWDREAPGPSAHRLVSHSTEGAAVSSNAEALQPALSGDGSVVVFTSAATDLVMGDLYFPDVFAASTATLDLELVSGLSSFLPWPVATGSAPSETAYAPGPTVSEDGRFAVFSSGAIDLAPGLAGPASWNIYLWDAFTRRARLVSHAFDDANRRGDGSSHSAYLSADGRWIYFQSSASDLIAGSSGGTDYNVYLWDRDAPATSSTRLVSHTPAGANVRSNSVCRWMSPSADGRYISYTSDSTDLVPGPGGEPSLFQLYQWDREAPPATANRLVSHALASENQPGDHGTDSPSSSADGRFVAFSSAATDLTGPATGNAWDNVFVWDRDSPPDFSIRLVSHAPSSVTSRGDNSSQAPVISGDGAHVAYRSLATDLVTGAGGPQHWNAFLWDRLAPTASANHLLSRSAGVELMRGNGDSYVAAVSHDGRLVGFSSFSTDLVPGLVGACVHNAYLWDRQAAAPAASRLISHAHTAANVCGNSGSGISSLSANGQYVVFESVATDLTPGETGPGPSPFPYGENSQLYRWDRLAPAESATTLISHTFADAHRRAFGDSFDASVSANGGQVVFSSRATDIATADFNDGSDAFWWSAADVAPPLFADDFATGDTSAWSATFP